MIRTYDADSDILESNNGSHTRCKQFFPKHTAGTLHSTSSLIKGDEEDGKGRIRQQVKNLYLVQL